MTNEEKIKNLESRVKKLEDIILSLYVDKVWEDDGLHVIDPDAWRAELNEG